MRSSGENLAAGWMYQRGISAKRDCNHASSRSLNIQSDEMLTISSINLLQYVTAQTPKACRQRRELHRLKKTEYFVVMLRKNCTEKMHPNVFLTLIA